MRASIQVLLSLGVASIAACSSGGGGGNGSDGGVTNPNTVQGVIALGTAKAQPIKITTAVVVAASSYTSGGVPTGTFYIEDPAPHSVNGISVYVATADMITAFPAVGDTVSVQGFVNTYDGSLQIGSDTTSGTPLVINDSGAGGEASAGAYSPAGTPTMVTATAQYSHLLTEAHQEQVGTVLQFAGPLDITDDTPAGFVETEDGGTTLAEGFEISGGVWVWDTNIYYDCMKGKGPDGGTLYPALTSGITGVWDHYQDFGTQGSTDYPVLIPQTCADVNLGGSTTTTDAGTTTVTDAGTGPVDAGVTYTVMTVQDAFNMARTMGNTTSVNVEIDMAAVVASSSYTPAAGGTAGTFYIQDAAPSSGNGIGVYVAAVDMLTVPVVGDVVNVQGNMSVFEAEIQISAYASAGVALTITPSGSNGMSSAGAYAPAGKPKSVAGGAAYAGTTGAIADGGHPELIGNAITFTGSLSILADAAPGLVHTKADGGTTSEGFEITNNIYVYDSNIYSTCIEGKSADGGPLYPKLTNGITGVWDRYTDYGADGGAAVYSVLIPQTCADLSP